MRTKAFIFLVLALSIGFVSSQDINGGPVVYDATQGAMSRNIYSTTIYYTPPPTQINLNSISKTMTVGLFDDTQTISYATALIQIQSPDLNGAPELVLKVENITINAARTQFTLNLRFSRNEVSAFNKYAKLGYSILFIGSNYGLQSSGLSSALARTGRLTDVSDNITPGSVDSAQFDFTGATGEASPFAFIPSTAACGVSRVGGVQRVQVLGCTKPIIITYISGFVYNGLPAKFDLTSYNVQPGVTYINRRIVDTLQQTPANTGYLYKSDANDQVVGPTVIFSNGVAAQTKQVQLSMVFVGLRTYGLTYPNGISDSFIAATGGLGYPAAPLTSAANPANDGLISPATTLLNIKNYNGNTDSNMGHLFCGFVELGPTTKNQLSVGLATSVAGNKQVTLLNSDNAGAAACLLFATRSTCVGKEVMVTSPSYTASSVTSPIVVTDRFLTNIAYPPAKLVQGYTVEITKIENLATTGKVTITKDYIVPAGRTEFVFYYDLSVSQVFGPAPTPISYVLTLAGKQYTMAYVPSTPSSYIIHVLPGTTKITAVFEITINTITVTPTVLTVKQGLYYFDKVVSGTQTCATTCPEVAGATTGVSTGANPPACQICQTNLFRYYRNGQCSCFVGYYQDRTTNPLVPVCQPCSDPICATCVAPIAPATTTTCSECVANSILTTVGTSTACRCIDGYYRSGSTCVPCPIGCSKCSSPTSCTQCRDSKNAANFITRLGSNFNCRCVDGYYDVTSSAVCQQCNPLCLTCSVSANSCDSCDAFKSLYKVDNTCKCIAGYYLLGDKCVPCSPICDQCDVSSIYCTKCPEKRKLVGTNNPAFKTCDCDLSAGYVEIDYGCVDISCADLDPYCQTCMLDLSGLRIRQCLTCTGNRIAIQGKCTCKPGFYAEGATCKACGAGCQTCTSATACTSCATGSSPNNDGTCTCKSGTILVQFSSSLYCQPCATNCVSCQGTANRCTGCKPGFQLVGNKCVCPTGTFTSSDGIQCFPCIANCNQCNDANTCTTCIDGFSYEDSSNQCKIVCSSGKFSSGTVCVNCPEGCQSCYSQTICNNCLDGFNMYAGSCRVTCPDGSFALNKQCYACPSQCVTCTSQTQCNQCGDGFVFIAGKCSSDCVKGTYLVDGSCRACDSSCATCSGAADRCLTCPNGLIFYMNKCVTTCPAAMVNGVCTSTCPDGQYFNGNACLNCNPKCKTCSAANTCTSCHTGVSSGGDCVQDCPVGQYASVGFCAKCDVSCATCRENAFNCITCGNGYIRVGNNCIESCGLGYFYDVRSQSCGSCNSGCKTCTSATQCVQCVDPNLSPVNGVCQRVCPSGANLIGSNCVCSIGFLHQSACVSVCPDGFYGAADKTCKMCASPCFTCSGAPNNCIKCISGYEFDSNKRCVQASKCPYGAVLVGGQCIRACSNGFFFNGGCVFSCPSGYVPNNFNGCIQSVTPTFCQAPQFQSGNSCVNQCPLNTWPNSVTRTCDRCTANCVQCLNANVCVACSSGFTLNYDQSSCVQSSLCSSNQFIFESECYQTCPYGTYQSGRYCLRACRDSLYFFEDFCYPSCPTDHYSHFACHRQCPSGVKCRSR